MEEKILQTFKDYVGIKLHFSEPGFYWRKDMKQNRIIDETLLKRKDYKFIDDFSNQFRKRDDQIKYLISAFLHDPSAWIGDIINDDFKAIHKARLKRINLLKVDFDTQVQNTIYFMEDNNLNIKDLLLTYGGLPCIIARQQEISGGITDEFLAVIDRGFKFCKQQTVDPLWQQKSFLLHKYSSLIEFDIKQLKGGLEKLAATEGKSPEVRTIITQQQKENKICHLPI